MTNTARFGTRVLQSIDLLHWSFLEARLIAVHDGVYIYCTSSDQFFHGRYLHSRDIKTVSMPKKVGVRNSSPRDFRSRIVRYWHPLGCRAIELGKPAPGVYNTHRRIYQPLGPLRASTTNDHGVYDDPPKMAPLFFFFFFSLILFAFFFFTRVVPLFRFVFVFSFRISSPFAVPPYPPPRRFFQL